MKSFLVVFVIAVTAVSAENSASNLVFEIYNDCVSQYSIACIKPRTLQWISNVANDDEIKITDNLSILKTAEVYEDTEAREGEDPIVKVVDAVEAFVESHAIRVKVPGEISDGAGLVPRSLVDGLPSELNMPLVDDDDNIEGRSKKKKIIKKLRLKKNGFLKKVLIPFLLGLKFKTTVLLPLTLALIAMKTWKALTLGLISLVLSGAMVIFKFTKPKVVNYEVIHYPQHVEHHVDHASTGWDNHVHAPYQARSDAVDPQEMAYNAQMKA